MSLEDYHRRLGIVAAMMGKSTEYCGYPIACLTGWIEPAILLEQIHFFHDLGGNDRRDFSRTASMLSCPMTRNGPALSHPPVQSFIASLLSARSTGPIKRSAGRKSVHKGVHRHQLGQPSQPAKFSGWIVWSLVDYLLKRKGVAAQGRFSAHYTLVRHRISRLHEHLGLVPAHGLEPWTP